MDTIATLFLTIGIPVVLGIVFLLLTGFVFARLYKRSTRETSLLRTGAGGRKVVIDGGCIVIPMIHELTKINMRTLQISVRRRGEDAMITKDRMRVDSTVEFFVRVKADENNISVAAQTLGDRTFSTDKLREMIEGKLVDGLRAVAAQMTMDELHEQRADFVLRVKEIVALDLEKNGLELESVSLTGLDQTPFATLDENNAFNAQGMRNLAETIAEQRVARAKAESEARVRVARTEQEAVLQEMEIRREEEAARVDNEVQISAMKAREDSEKAKRDEEVIEAREAARIRREQTVQEATISSRREVEISEQNTAIAIAQKSQEESLARKDADLARAEAIKAEEAVKTARDTEIAERQKRISIIAAEEAAERDATGIRVSANAERQAAEDRAEALRVEATAEAEATTIRAAAEKTRMLAEAEGKEKLIAAENALSGAILAHREALQKLAILPAMLEAMVKPMEKVDSIRIHHVNGLGGSAAGGTGGNTGGGSALNDLDGLITRQTVQIPLLRKIAAEAGVTIDAGMEGLLGSLEQAVAPATPAAAAPEAAATDDTTK